MKYGLSEEQLTEIHNILASHSEIEEAVIYGSRAIGTYKEASDVDIAIKGEKAGSSLASKLKYDLEEKTYLPFFFDTVAYITIDSDELKEHINTKGKTIYRKGWREVQLGEVCTFHRGKGLSKKEIRKDGKYPCILYGELFTKYSGRIKNIISRTDSIEEKFLSKKGDILMPSSDVTPNGLATASVLYEDGIILGGDIIVIRCPQNQMDGLFFCLYVSANKQSVLQLVSGTTVLHISKSHLAKFKILLPPLSEQKAIAEVLDSLDDKIDLLQCQNKTLEDIAQTLFRKWFIEDADERWEKKPLSYFGNIICGKTPSKKVAEYFGGHIPFIKIPDMHGKTFVFRSSDTLSKEGRDSQKNAIIPPKSICVSCIATVGLVSMNAFESQTNQQINSVIPKKDEYRYYIYLFMKSSTTLLKAMASGGTATMNLNTRNFSEILLPVPSSNKIFTFHVKVKSLFDKMFSNQSQIRDIERLRDTLLPKLVNGKVRVN